FDLRRDTARQIRLVTAPRPVASPDESSVASDDARVPIETTPGVDSTAAPNIRLADCIVHAGPRGAATIVTRFLLTPTILTQCQFKLPDGQQLVAVNMDGQPAFVRAVSGNGGTIDLVSS